MNGTRTLASSGGALSVVSERGKQLATPTPWRASEPPPVSATDALIVGAQQHGHSFRSAHCDRGPGHNGIERGYVRANHAPSRAVIELEFARYLCALVSHGLFAAIAAAWRPSPACSRSQDRRTKLYAPSNWEFGLPCR